MLALVKEAHAAQSRNNGRVPYWMHVQAVAQMLDFAIARGREINYPLRERICLAALGHDLYEDTKVTRADIEKQFGDDVAGWIQGMTNDGDADRKAYLARMAAAPEEVRLIKLADVLENTTSVSYAIPDMGIEWVQGVFLPIATEMHDLLGKSEFTQYPRTAQLLVLMFDFQLKRLEDTVVMYTGTPKRRGGLPLRDITKDEWAEALRRRQEKEKRRAEEIYGDGPIFPIPTPDSDS